MSDDKKTDKKPKNADGRGSTGVKPDGRHYFTAMVAGHRIWGYGRDTEKPRRLKDGPKKAEADFEKKKAAHLARQPVTDPERTLAEWVEQWFALLEANPDLRASSKSRDRTMLNKHVVQHSIGTTRLCDLTPPQLVVWRDDRIGGDDPLKPASLLKVIQALNKAFKSALERGLLLANPLDGVKRPTVKVEKIKTLTLEEQKRVLDHIKGEQRTYEGKYEWRTCDPGRPGAVQHGDHWRVRTFVKGYVYSTRRSNVWPLLVAITYTGLRKGEGIALKWSYVDLEAGMIRIEKTEDRHGRRDAKTEAGQRWVPMGDGLRALLRAQKARQAEDRLKAGPRWAGTGHVFTTAYGTPLADRDVLRPVEKAAKALGLADGDVKVNVHALRHAYGTNLLLAGVDPTTIKELLGHADLRTTDRYMHPTAAHLRAAVVGLDERLTRLG